MKPRIVFFGSDEYSLIVLKTLIKDKRFEIVGVVTLPRTQIIKKFSQRKNLPLIDYASMNQFIEATKKLQPDVGILASFGKILPEEILNIPSHGILNIHPSLLPKYRGPTPIPSAILNDEKETGVTIIKIDGRVDHGPIAAQFKEKIKPHETAHDLLKRLFATGADALATILPAYCEGQIKLRKQNHSQTTYTKRFTRDNGKIDWRESDEYLERFIRAMHPWPGAWTKVKVKSDTSYVKRRLKIIKAHLEKDKLVLDQVQLEGKKPVAWKQLQEGYPEAKFVS